MAKKDSRFFDRLREAGLRKSVARQLSEAGDDAGKKLQRAARATAKELRAVADEIERRLPPSETPLRSAAGTASTTTTRGTRSAARKPAAPRSARKPAAPRTSGARASGSGTTGRATRQTKPNP